jgi:serine/threonine protein kinase
MNVELYEKLGTIGRGTYGTVYKANDRKSNKIVALKRIVMHPVQRKDEGFPITSIRELSTLRRCSQHENVVQLNDVVVSQDNTFLVFEYCENDLQSLLPVANFNPSDLKRLSLQLLSAVRHLHQHWILHRDIKLPNILYSNNGALKLADFGLARKFSHDRNQVLTPGVQTLWYRAPEVLLGGCYTEAIDMWSVGCVLAELSNKSALIPAEDAADALLRISKLLGSPNKRIWPEMQNLPLIANGAVNFEDPRFKAFTFNELPEKLPNMSEEGISLISGLLVYSPNRRMTARAALGHEYFDIFPFPTAPNLMPTFKDRGFEVRRDMG